LAYGVIGNTPVFGTDIQGSSPCRPTKKTPNKSNLLGVFIFTEFL
jgi:hypothetical protein